MNPLKIRKTIDSDSLELKGLSQFQGQEVEIIISPVSSAPPADASKSFLRFAGIAASEADLLKDLEAEIQRDRDLDRHRELDL